METITGVSIKGVDYDIQDKNALPKTGGVISGEVTFQKKLTIENEGIDVLEGNIFLTGKDVFSGILGANAIFSKGVIHMDKINNCPDSTKIAVFDTSGNIGYIDKSSISGGGGGGTNGTQIVVQASQPTGQKTGDFWYQVIS